MEANNELTTEEALTERIDNDKNEISVKLMIKQLMKVSSKLKILD